MTSSRTPTNFIDPTPSIPSKILGALPPWIRINLKSSASWKLLIRCWLASWAAFVLILPNNSLKTLGNAAFFCCICSFIVPPFLPVQTYFFAMTTMLIGCLLGWGLGSAAMRAGLAARSQVLLRSQIQRATETAAGQANPDAVFKLEVFQGVFLDVRSTVIFGVFLAVGAFFFSLVRAYRPKLALFSVFGTVFLDVICSYGPLFPTSQYFILNSFFISTTSYVAIGCAVIFLVFPETLNHQYLNGISGILASVRELFEAQERVLHLPIPTDTGPITKEIQEKTAAMISGMQKLDEQGGMLGLEFTFGRFNGDDAQIIEQSLKVVVSRIAGLQTFSRLINVDSTAPSSDDPPLTDDTPAGTLHAAHEGDTHLLSQLRAAHLRQEFERGLRPRDILPVLQAATSDLRGACIHALSVSEQLIARVNRRRWQPTPAEPEPNLDDRLNELRHARDDFRQRRRLEVVEPFSALSGKHRPYRALFMALVFEANLAWCADATISLVEALADLAQRRKKARVWAPKGLRLLWKVLSTSDESDKRALGEDEPPMNTNLEGSEKVSYRKDPDSSPPTNIFQRAGNFSYHAYLWCKTPEAIYAFKYTLVSVALWLPGVFPHSAYFNYANKGIWALIMAQTTLEPYVADQIYSYVARLTATTAGIILGLVAWYIGSGNGSGNPYGAGAVMAVFFLPLMFWRLFTPSPMPAIMCSVTVVLVVGYSWLDSHLQIVGNPGVGWPVAWRRWVLVMIGAGASFFLMLFPPKSGRLAVRLHHAGLILQLSQLYARLVSVWLEEEEGEGDSSRGLSREPSPKDDEKVKGPRRNGDVEDQRRQKPDLPAWATEFRYELVGVWCKVQMMRMKTQTAKYEGNIRGAWPSNAYFELLDVETEMLANLSQLAGALTHLDPAWRVRLLHRTKVLNPHFIADVITVFSLVSQSLRTGEPLHEVVPHNLVDRVFYHHTLIPVQDQAEEQRGGGGRRLSPDVADELDQLRSEAFMAYATGVTAMFKILTLLDRLHQITKSLCGEVPLQGFREWKEAFERRLPAIDDIEDQE